MSDSIFAWSTTASDNDDADSTINWTEGQNPSTVNNSARAVMARVSEFLSDITSAKTTAGTGAAYTVTATQQPASLPDGFTLLILPHADNTGTCTIDVNGLGAKALRSTSAENMAAGVLKANQTALVAYRQSSDEFLVLAGKNIDQPAVQQLIADSAPTKNYIVNPGMRISQENGSSSSTTHSYFPADQWIMGRDLDGTLTTQQVTSATPGGSENRIRMTVTSADTSIAADQYAVLLQYIEGLRTADLQWGTANATDVVLRFGFKGPAGTYAVTIKNQDANRSFVREFTISGGDANTDTLQTLTFPGDTSGTWDKDNTRSFQLVFTFAAGSTYQTTSDSWQAGNYLGTSSTSNGIGTTSDVFELFDVGLYADPDSTGLAPRFELPHYDIDLLECQRYYVKFSNVLSYYSGTASGHVYESTQLPTDMRSNPSLSVLSQFQYYSGGTPTNFTPTLLFISPRNIVIVGNGLSNANGLSGGGDGAASARL